MNYDALYPNAPLPRRRAGRFVAGCAMIYAAAALVFLPLSIWFGSDIVFAGTYLYEIFTWLGSGAELLAFCLLFSSVVGARFLYGVRAALRTILLYAAIDVGRYLATFLITWRMAGIDADDIVFELIFLLIYVLLDVTLATVVLVFTHLLLRENDLADAIRAQAMLSRGDCLPDRVAYYLPSKQLLAMHGPLASATLVGGILILILRAGGRIIYDIGYGLPTDGVDLAWMLLYYLTDIALSVLCCAVIRRLFIRYCYPKETL